MKHIVTLIFLLAFIGANSQDESNRNLRFVQHLIGREEYSDALYYISTHLNDQYPMPFRDSLNYLKGWSHYSLKELKLSAEAFCQVSSDSPYFLKSRFFAAYDYSYIGLTAFSNRILTDLNADKKIEALRNFELAGNSLLNRDLDNFHSYFKKIETFEQFSFDLEKGKFIDYAAEIGTHRNKSMIVGGLMSAIIPGSGKIYAGKTGEGISSLLIVGAAGATAWENYHKLGLKNAKTILFGSLFAVLYIGNIYGTVFTVKLVNEEFNHEMDNKILFNMHIPLRNFFN
jgi:hypothetical protein